MIIHQPEVIQKDGKAILWSKIEMDKKRDNFPDYIWYRIPENYGAHLNTQSDAFLVSSLLAAMHFGEDIRVRGTISPRLAYHLEEYQYLLNFRMPDVLHLVSIQYEHLAPIEEKPKGVGATFSGGVDSLFTIWKHLPQNQPDPNYQISHGIFIRGFDILHSENDYYQKLAKQYTKQASQIGIDLIEIETNIVSTVYESLHLHLPHLFGPLLISTAIALSGLFQRFYIPSSWDYYTLEHAAYASDPLMDRFLSTDTMEIIHHGSADRRFEKVEELSDWKPAQEHLRVCGFPYKGDNCSRCEKCTRTMLPLYALGKMHKFKTFSKPFKSNIDTLWWARKFDLRNKYMPDAFIFAKKHNSDILPWLYLAAFLGSIRYFLIRLLPQFIKKWSRRYGYFLNDALKNSDWNNKSIIDLIKSQNTPKREI
ncbi:MAG: hypothetical protein GY755_09525 [Chloroflexi bacterium]|nr:hypothetical protein [Chloroflexota bacterium]